MLSSTSSSSSWNALADLVVSRGGYIGPIAVQEPVPGLRGLFCTSDGVRAGEPLLAVPADCTLRGTAKDGQRPIERLITALLAARSAGDAGDHALYLETLPRDVPLLRDWDAGRLELLRAPEVAARVIEQHAWLDRLCEGQEHAHGTSADDVRWAERLVRSRGVSFSDAASKTTGLQLVPLLDFANHRRADAEAEPAVIETGDGMIALCASPTGANRRELNRGDEATFAYTSADEGNERLLLDYGFAQLGADEYAGLTELEERLSAAPEETADLLWSL